jgi:peptide deformylase
MATQKIVLYEKDPKALRGVSAPVPVLDQDVSRLIRDLKDTLANSIDGIGLAAPQINVHSRVIVVRLGGGRGEREPGPPLIMVNPEILQAGDARRDIDGCLSFPGLYGETVRPHFVRVEALGENGEPIKQIYEGFDAVVVHHEVDHLNGVLFIDRLEKTEDLFAVAENNRGELVRRALSRPPSFLAQTGLRGGWSPQMSPAATKTSSRGGNRPEPGRPTEDSMEKRSAERKR